MTRYDFNTDLELREELRDTIKIVQTQVASLATQLGAWLVLGNSAGIFFLANAAETRIAVDGQFNHLYLLFLVGAALGFAAMCWTYLMSIPLVATFSRMGIELLLRAQREQLSVDLEKDGKKPPAEFETADAASTRLFEQLNERVRLAWVVFGVAIGLYFLSAVCFLVGLAAPLTGAISFAVQR